MSNLNVPKWMLVAPFLGVAAMGCGDSNTRTVGEDAGDSLTGGASGGGGEGQEVPQGGGGSGVGGNSAGAGGNSAGAAGSSGSSNATGGAGGTIVELGYDPVGIGDPWFFSVASEFEAFQVEYSGATGSASWSSAGEVHVPASFAQAGDKVFIHFTAPWDAVQGALAPVDLTHRVLKARVKIASGATASGGVEPYAQSTSGWTWTAGDWNSFGGLGEFRDVEFDFDTAALPSSVLRFGLQVYGTGAGNAELIIDDLRLEPKDVTPVEGDAGSGSESDAGYTEPPVESDAGAGAESDAGSSEPSADGGAGLPDSGGGGGGLGYEPLGIGDPWFFDAESEMGQFTFAFGGGATGSNSWSNGEVHVPTSFTASGGSLQMQFTTPWNGSTNTADMTGRVIRARLRVAAGATASGGVQVFTQSAGWSWVTSGWNDLGTLGSAIDVTFPLTSASNAANVQRFGIQLYATSAGSAELIVDDIRIEPEL